MKAFKKNALIAILLFVAISATAAVLKKEILPYDDCTTTTAFWGERCCEYQVIMNTVPGPVSVVFRKCCDYRFFFPTNCGSIATGMNN
jgi:hypothetical protein